MKKYLVIIKVDIETTIIEEVLFSSDENIIEKYKDMHPHDEVTIYEIVRKVK